MEGVEIDVNKTEYLCICQSLSDFQVSDNVVIKACAKYKYSGIIISKEGSGDEYVRHRLNQRSTIQK